jgi:hypothetical protein
LAYSVDERPGALWGVREGRTLFESLSENIRECYRHAENCRREAKEQRDPAFRQDFLDCERRWLLLARGYESAERLETFSQGFRRAPHLRMAA